MRRPIRITVPQDKPLTLSAAKAHLRVTHDAEDDLIQSLIDAATAHLDGWGGVLGRAIMRQTWREEFCGWGCHRLALPDVDAATVLVTGIAKDGAEIQPEETKVIAGAGAWMVRATGSRQVETVRVEYECEMPEDRRASVAMVMKLLVAHWYAHREAASADAPSAVPLAVDSLISPLRWRPV